MVTLTYCGTKPLVNPPSSIEDAVSSVEGSIDATFLTECIWREEAYNVGNTTPKLALKAHQEMSLDFEQCYLRHNALVELLTSQ